MPGYKKYLLANFPLANFEFLQITKFSNLSPEPETREFKDRVTRYNNGTYFFNEIIDIL